eukprot:15448298-Alexandrium_andersonii.AAC.1
MVARRRAHARPHVAVAMEPQQTLHCLTSQAPKAQSAIRSRPVGASIRFTSQSAARNMRNCYVPSELQ